MQAEGVRVYRRWSDLDKHMLDRFYPIAHAELVACGLECAVTAIRAKAHVRGLSAPRVRNLPPTDGEKCAFWEQWRAYISKNINEWMDNGWAEGALKLTWQPGLDLDGDCLPGCSCDRSADFLPCERVTVGRWLKSNHIDVS